MPESELECRMAEDPVLLKGWAWGRPRQGHPEGSVGAHVADLLRTIEDWGETGRRRAELRFLALVHDSLKFEVDGPEGGEDHHAERARALAEALTDDERLLAVIQEHDTPYGIWRKLRRSGSLDEAALSEMLDRIPDLDLFLQFVELDGSTEGKNPEPVEWFRDELRGRGKPG